MVKDPALLYGLTAAFGSAFLSPLLLSLRQGGMPSELVLPVFFLAILGAVFLVGGV